MNIVRESPRGLKFSITGNTERSTITLIGSGSPPKKIETSHSIDSINQGYFFWYQGPYIQDAFKIMSASEREFILSGVTPEEWAKLFPPDADE